MNLRQIKKKVLIKTTGSLELGGYNLEEIIDIAIKETIREVIAEIQKLKNEWYDMISNYEKDEDVSKVYWITEVLDEFLDKLLKCLGDSNEHR